MAWIGIDLGTYNSSAAIKTRQGAIEIVKSLGGKSKGIVPFISQQEKYKEFPSFISFNKDGTINEIGMNSKEQAYSEPEFVVWGVKRLLGKTYTELKESGELDRFPYRIRPDRTNGQCLVVIGEKPYTPVQLCAEIFKKIKSDAEAQINGKIDSAVISVPAYFDPVRVTPIVDAARLAGFIHHAKTIPEPVAAALAYHIDITVKPIKVVVFDLGAGTLDVTAGYLYRHPAQPGEFKFQVMKNTGDSKLGGIDMDDRLLRLIQERCQLSNIAPAKMAILRRVAEIAKIRLSEETKIEDVFKLDEKEYPYTLNQFDLKSTLEGTGVEKNLLEGCRHQIMSAIHEAEWTPQEIELLIMIGGPTKLPCIYEVFKIIFYSNPIILQQLEEFYSGKEKVDRMTAVSIGAMMSVDRNVDDRVPYGHGIEDIEFADDQMIYRPNILVPRDSTYPFKSKPYMIPWINLHGLFEFKIIQHVPKSEIQQFGFEYRFVGIQKFAVKNPNMCMVVFQMGYNANKELEVTIKNALTTQSETYVGINNFACIGMNYPLSVKRPPDFDKSKIKKTSPSPETLDMFIKWVQQSPVRLIQKKVDDYPIPQMLISQILDEIGRLLKKGDPKSDYETVYTKVNSLIWNSNSRGLLTQSEYIELMNHLTEYEGELFRITLK